MSVPCPSSSCAQELSVSALSLLLCISEGLQMARDRLFYLREQETFRTQGEAARHQGPGQLHRPHLSQGPPLFSHAEESLSLSLLAGFALC